MAYGVPMTGDTEKRRFSRADPAFQLSGRLQFARTAVLRLTQRELAERLWLSEATLNNYENVRVELPADIALRFCREAFIDERWLATGKEPLRPGVDLSTHPACASLNLRMPYHSVFPALADVYESLAAQDFVHRITGLLKQAIDSPIRSKALYDWLFEVLSAQLNDKTMARFAHASLSALIDAMKQADTVIDFTTIRVQDASFNRVSRPKNRRRAS